MYLWRIILKEHRRAKGPLVTTVLNWGGKEKKKDKDETRLQRQLEPQDYKLAGPNDLTTWNMESSMGRQG